MTYEARIATSNAGTKSKFFCCQAIIANTTPTILFANFLVKNHDQNFPIRVFSNFKEAKVWINDIKKDLNK
jgi:hypothetical protein